MMELHTLKPPENSRKKRRRVGRGPGSGSGKTSGRGHKGQMSRSGARHRIGFEGGQMPLHRRVPKFGFTNIFKKEFQIVNVQDLIRCDGPEITPENLHKAGLIRNTRTAVKILGNGKLDKAFTVKAKAFSKSAVSKIEAAGGKVEVL